MTKMRSYAGIDYGLGRSNIDTETGIRFGVVCMNALNEWAWEDVEADYGDPHCPKCGNEALRYEDAVKLIDERQAEGVESEDELENYHSHTCADWACLGCKLILEGDDVFGDEPVGHTLDDGDYKGFVDSSNDLMLLKSPYFTYAQYCSPCAPGAGHLENPCFAEVQFRFPRSKKARIRKKWAKRKENWRLEPRGAKTYALGHDWWPDGVCPYPIFDVATGKQVHPETKR